MDDIAKLALDLRSDDLGVVERARVQMESLRGKPLDPILAMLDAADPDIRIGAGYMLAEIGGEAAIHVLEPLLADDNENVRNNIDRALSHLAGGLTVESLLTLLSDESSALRGLATWALAFRKDRRTLEPLTVALHDPSPIVRARASAAIHLMRMSYGADLELPVAELLALLSDTSPEVRSAAAEALEFGDPDLVIPPLAAALRDAAALVRGRAALSLMMTQDPRAVEILLKMPDDPDANVRRDLAYALSRTQTSFDVDEVDERVVERLGALLDDPERSVRIAAIEGFGWMQDSRGIDRLITLRNSEDEELRKCAEEALGQIGRSCAVDETAVLQYELPEHGYVSDLSDVRQVAEKLKLLEIAKQRFERDNRDEECSQLSERDVQLLQMYARDSEPVLRAAAVDFLAEYGPVTWEDAERWMMDERSGVRDAACFYLGLYGALAELCSTDTARCAALIAQSARRYGHIPVQLSYMCQKDPEWMDLMWAHLGPLLDLGDAELNSSITCGILEDLLPFPDGIRDPRLQSWIEGDSIERKMALLSVVQWFGMREPWQREITESLAGNASEVVSRTARSMLASVPVQDIQCREWAEREEP